MVMKLITTLLVKKMMFGLLLILALSYHCHAQIQLDPPNGISTQPFQVAFQGSSANTLYTYTSNGEEPRWVDEKINPGDIITINKSATIKVKAWHYEVDHPAVLLPGNTYSSDYYVTGTISVGWRHATQIRPGNTPAAWGTADLGALSNGALSTIYSPIPSHVFDYKQNRLGASVDTASGAQHSLFLLASGEVYACGDNNDGALGNPDAYVTIAKKIKKFAPFSYPVKFGPGLTVLPLCSQVAAGDSFSLALGKNGYVYSWGLFSDGRLGDGITSKSSVRNYAEVVLKKDGSVLAPLDEMDFISAGTSHSAAIEKRPSLLSQYQGRVWMWGDNSKGQLANGLTKDLLAAEPVKANATTFLQGCIDVSCGQTHTVFLLENTTYNNVILSRSVWSAGSNANGMLGNTNVKSTSTYPVPVLRTSADGVSLEPLQNIAQVSASPNHTLALDGNGAVWSWGANSFGELGTGDTKNSSVATKVKISATEFLKDIIFVEAGGAPGKGVSMAMAKDGSLYTWGNNAEGQFGNGEFNASKNIYATKLIPSELGLAPTTDPLDDPDGADLGSLNALAEVASPDGTTKFNNRLLGRWDFETYQINSTGSSGHPAWRGIAGNLINPGNGTTGWDGPSPRNSVGVSPFPTWPGAVPSSGAHINKTGSYLAIDQPYFFDQVGTHSWCMWLRFPKNSLREAETLRPFVSAGIQHASNLPNIATFFSGGNNPTLQVFTYPRQTLSHAGTLIGEIALPLSDRLHSTDSTRSTILDDGDWHHVVLTYDTSKNITFTIDAVDYATSTSQTFLPSRWSSSYTPFAQIGKFHPRASLPYPLVTKLRPLGASIDRLRIYGRKLNQTEKEKLYNQDIDRDGIFDRIECSHRIWSDNPSLSGGTKNDLIDFSEISHGSDPFMRDDLGSDHDGDGLSTIDEQNVYRTDPFEPDTDGDLLPDDWELASGTNANNSQDALLDLDKDGLTNLDEYRYNASPQNKDSDGDGANDAVEVALGSHPNDPSDEGKKPESYQINSIRLAVGDNSASSSEDYVINVFRLDPLTGQEIRHYTLRSGGFGQYTDETKAIYRKDQTYTFQLEWKGSNRVNQSDSGGNRITQKGPDLDYTFIVEPQGEHGGVLVDSYDSTDGKINTDFKLIEYGTRQDCANQNVQEFRTTYSQNRVLFFSMYKVSADRSLYGRIVLPKGLLSQITWNFASSTLDHLGSYENLLSPTWKMHASERDFLNSESPSQDIQSDEQKLWLVRKDTTAETVEFFTCYNVLGEAQIGLFAGSLHLGTVKHMLKKDDNFSEYIEKIDAFVKGEMFQPYVDPAIPLVVRRSAGRSAGIPGQIQEMDNYTRATLAPLFFVVGNAEALANIFHGLIDGVTKSIEDDLELLELIGTGLAYAGDWAYTKAKEDLLPLLTSFEARAKLLDEVMTTLINEWVLVERMTYEDVKVKALQVWDSIWNTGVKVFNFPKDVTISICGSIFKWWNNFVERIADESEVTHFESMPWSTDPFLSSVNAGANTFSYGLGFTTGYIGMQVITGIATSGVYTAGKILVKGGIRVVSLIAARRVLPILARVHLLKKWSASLAVSIELKHAIELSVTKASKMAVSPSNPISPLELIEKRLASQAFNRSQSTMGEILDRVLHLPGLVKLLKGQESHTFWIVLAQGMEHLPSISPDGIKGFFKVMANMIWHDSADALIKTHMDDFIRCLGTSAAKKLILEQSLVNLEKGSGELAPDLMKFMYLTMQDATKQSLKGKHPAMDAFYDRVDTLAVEVAGTAGRKYEGLAGAHLELILGRRVRRPVASDLKANGKPLFSEEGDFVATSDFVFENHQRGDPFFDVKGPIAKNEGFLEDYATLSALRLDIARTAIDKIVKLDAMSAGPNKVFMDLFGLDEAAKTANKNAVAGSSLTVDQKARIIISE